MNRIDRQFAEHRSRPQGRRGAIMPFICGGHPTPGATARLLPALSAAGAAVIEVGIPFSDPIADGPVIAAAMHDALGLGATPVSVMEEIRSARAATSAAIVAMVSISLIERAGPDAFIKHAAASGVDGLIIPDLPLEESTRLCAVARDAGLKMALLIAPTTSDKRAATIARNCTGFVYLLARAGITGEQATLDTQNLGQRIARLRSETDLPIACGFGISDASQVRAIVAHADAAIVGSALVRRVEAAAKAGQDPVAAASAFVKELRAGADAGA